MTVLLATSSSLEADPTLLVDAAMAVVPLPLTSVGRAADLLAAATPADPILVLVRPADRRSARRAVVESFTDPAAVIERQAAVSQLGARLLAHLLMGVEAEHGAVVAAELVEPLAGALDCRLVLSSVAKLDDPSPSIAQHVRSWWPKACFQVLSGRRRLVHSGPAEPPGRRGSRPDELALFASAATCRPVVREQARGLATDRPCRELPPWPEVARETAAGWVELVIWSPSEVQEIVAAFTGQGSSPCRWCGRPVRHRVG